MYAALSFFNCLIRSVLNVSDSRCSGLRISASNSARFWRLSVTHGWPSGKTASAAERY
jgi:hypothetical protein